MSGTSLSSACGKEENGWVSNVMWREGGSCIGGVYGEEVGE